MANTMSTNREVGNIINKLIDMASKIQDLKENADQIITIASTMGETAKNFVESQLRDYFIPTLDKLGWGEGTGEGDQGSILKIAQFLGNCTYAQVANNDFLSTISGIRQDVSNYRSSEMNPMGVSSPNQINNDVYVPGTGSSSEVSSLPQNMSYSAPAGENPDVVLPESVEEHQEKLKEYTLYQVVRCSDIVSDLSQASSRIKDQVVSEFDNKEEAEERAEILNKSVTPAEKELLKVSYKVVGLER